MTASAKFVPKIDDSSNRVRHSHLGRTAFARDLLDSVCSAAHETEEMRKLHFMINHVHWPVKGHIS